MLAPMQVIALLLILLSSPSAGLAMVVLDEQFAGDSANFTAGDTWSNSYCKDGWRTDLNDGVIASLDDSCPECACNFLVQTDGVNNCLESDPMDNHIQAGNPDWQNYTYTVRFRNDDDDTMGIVFRYADSANFYLFTLAQSSSPTAQACADEFNGARLIRARKDIGGVLLKEVAGLTYQTGMEHLIRATVNGRHLKVEFDHNGDGQFGANEIFYDQDDDAQAFIPAGSVGLYTFNNGANEANGDPSQCAGGGCWFDDALVALLPPNNQNCGEIGWEGQCEGNTLKYCNALGELKTKNCGPDACCRWVDAEDYFTCVPGAPCDTCEDSCAPGYVGCSSNLTHAVTCGQSDADLCLEPVLTVCAGDAVCDPSTGECALPCQSQCAGKNCGDDGCGGSCGGCADGEECLAGECQAPALGVMGDPCESAGDCLTMMCVTFEGAKVCSKACSGGANCPLGFICSEVTVSGVTLEGCVPANDCIPDCTAKLCGTDGCEGSCGSCDDGFACQGGSCKSDAGATCDGPGDCAGGLCVAFQSGIFCSAPCSTDDDCPEKWHCNPWVDPTTPDICAPHGNMVAHETCGEVAECMGSCPPNNDACVTSCFFFGAAQAQQGYADLLACAQTDCFPECGDDEVCFGECFQVAIEGPCADAWNACLQVCTPVCEGLECGDDGCGGECGQCDADSTCVAGICTVDRECLPDAAQRCVGDSIYWFDSCDEQGELVAACASGCEGDACMVPVGQDDIAAAVEDNTSGIDGGGVTLSASKGSGGCSAARRTHGGWALWLALAVLLALTALRRSRHA